VKVVTREIAPEASTTVSSTVHALDCDMDEDCSCQPPATPGTPIGLSDEDLVRACRNIGYDLRCGACAEFFFTGALMHAHDPLCSTVNCAWFRGHKKESSADYVFRCDACDAAFDHPTDDDCPTIQGFCAHLMRAGWRNVDVRVYRDESPLRSRGSREKILLSRGGWLCASCVDRYIGPKRVRAGRVSVKEGKRRR